MWQEGLQNGDTWTWQEYLEGLDQGDPSQPGPARKFWRQMSVAAIAGRWLGLTGSDDFTIVTVPPPGADRRLLLERFSVAVGLDPDPLELPHRDNASLGAASAEVLRSVNARLASLGELEGERRFRRRMFVKHRLSKQGLAPHRAQESPIGFPGGHWVDARADTIISRLAGLGVRVVGDLDDLRPCPVPGVDPSEVPAVEREAAATAALAHLAELWSTLQTEPTRRT
jgi:hypothetical protein